MYMVGWRGRGTGVYPIAVALCVCVNSVETIPTNTADRTDAVQPVPLTDVAIDMT